MALLVSAKGSDILAWRAAGDFAVTFRQVTLHRMEFCRSDEAAAMLTGASQALDDLAAANAFLDGFARYRNELVIAGTRKGATISIAWPFWKVACTATKVMRRPPWCFPCASWRWRGSKLSS